MFASIVQKVRLAKGDDTKNPHARLKSPTRRYHGPLDGEILDKYFGNLVTKGHNTDGRAVAIKFKTAGFFQQSETDMMAYAHSQNLLAPAVWECRYLENSRIAMIADFVPGDSLDKV